MDNSERPSPTGTLYVVATPIGNKADITLRALDTLRSVDIIAAEDTRKTGRLLSQHNIQAIFLSYHEHNEDQRTPELIRNLLAGKSIALVSDAGTPSVSDPGYRLISVSLTNDISVVPIPGVSAVTAALSVSGLPTDSFVFIGFPARKKNRRLGQLKALVSEERTVIFYESPKRIGIFLKEILEIMGDRPAVLAREMTKVYEEFIRGTITVILEAIGERPVVKGECTLLIKGRETNTTLTPEALRAEIQRALERDSAPISKLSKDIAKQYGLLKKDVYAEALALKKQINGDRD